jgi:phosphatidylinositol alpha-1,6-mannosyltransferase
MSEEREFTHLLITNDLGPHIGGIEIFLIGLLTELNKELLPGARVLIYTNNGNYKNAPDHQEFDRDLAARLGVKIIRDPSRTLLPTKRTAVRIKKLILQYQIQYVFYGATAPLALMTRSIAPKENRGTASNPVRRVIGISHGHEVWWAKVPGFKKVMKKIGSSLDGMTYLGEFTKQEIRKGVGQQLPMKQLAPGINYELFHPGEKSTQLLSQLNLNQKKIIVCVGRLVKRKGQDKLIQSMPEILKSEPDAHLLIVGTGPLANKLHKLVAKLNLNSSVTFVGRVNYQELPKYFQLGNVFAMPARARLFGLEVEGLGIVYLEASAAGIPVVVGNSGGAPDAVIDGVTGLLVDPNSTQEISQKILSLLADPVKANQLGIAGRNWVEEFWRWDIWAERFTNFLWNGN